MSQSFQVSRKSIFRRSPFCFVLIAILLLCTQSLEAVRDFLPRALIFHPFLAMVSVAMLPYLDCVALAPITRAYEVTALIFLVTMEFMM